jgi:hypothetical protein
VLLCNGPLLFRSVYSNENPYRLTRDIVIKSALATAGQLDFQFLSGKVLVGPGVTVTLENLVVRNVRCATTATFAVSWHKQQQQQQQRCNRALLVATSSKESCAECADWQRTAADCSSSSSSRSSSSDYRGVAHVSRSGPAAFCGGVEHGSGHAHVRALHIAGPRLPARHVLLQQSCCGCKM